MNDPLNGRGYRRTVLQNGIRVITEELSHVNSVSIGIWVINGSRDEAPGENGISHFIEHLLFKGTERRTAYDIAREIDSVGGVLNAFTEREHTCFFAKVIDKDLPLAIDLLSDIFLNPVFDPEELERERAVILEEIKMVEDTPDDYVHDLFSQMCWGEHPLGLPIQGTVEIIQSLARDHLRRYFRDHYQPGRIIICAAGRVGHNEVVDAVGNRFGGMPKSDERLHRQKPRLIPGIRVYEKDLEQVHLCLGTKGLPYPHPFRSALFVLNTILGGGMSSRLFQEIREIRGLAYSVQSFPEAYSDEGMLVVYAATRQDSFPETIRLTRQELTRLQMEPLQSGILETAKKHLKGNLILGLESSDTIMTRLAKNEIYFNAYLPLEQVLKNIDDVTKEDVRELASKLFSPDDFCLTLLGPVPGGDLQDLLRSHR